jgi:cobalt-zinc-cadmium efflux system membrane fusion protein
MPKMNLRVLLATITLAFFGQCRAGAWRRGSQPGRQEAGRRRAGRRVRPAALQRLADGSLFVPKPVQRQLGMRTQPARIGDLAATIELNGKVIADPNTGGRVQATFAGSVMPGPKGMPTAGTQGGQGRVLAWLRPVAAPSNAATRGHNWPSWRPSWRLPTGA